MVNIEQLEPREFFAWFARISEIPRDTGNEQGMILFLQNYARERGFECKTDGMGNVFMNIPPTQGYETEPTILLQAHMDMVCVKEPNVQFDFETEPLRLKLEGNHLIAEGTSLGADNGVGIATMLAIGDAKNIAHPALEFLFTVKEEIGMVGIRAFDMDCIKARRMINMDCGDSHVIAVSSMGQHKVMIRRKYVPETLPMEYETCRLHFYGGMGGHSGLSIQEGRACAANSIGEILTLPKHMPIRLCEVCTEGRPILKECFATIAYPQKFANDVKDCLKQNFLKIQNVHNITDPELKMDILPEYNMHTAIGEQETEELIKLLCLIKTAPHHVEENVVITLSGISKVLMRGTALELEMQVRSSVSEEMEDLFAEYKKLAEQLGFSVEIIDGYGGWEESSESSFREKFMKIHRQLFGCEMDIERVAGGIETGVITHSIPEMDAVGIAPTARGAHTTKEYLDVAETKDYWKLLIEVLQDRTNTK